MLSPEEIISIIKKPAAAQSLERAQAIQVKHKLIVKGEGYKENLLQRRMIGMESATLFKAKIKFARPATPALMQKFINQFSKIFRAQGFNETYTFKGTDKTLEKDAKEYLSKVWAGKSLFEMMQHKWSSQLLEDFNGVYLVELPAIEKGSKATPFIDFYGLRCIHDIQEDDSGIQYLILKEDQIVGDEKITEYRYIDDEQDTIFIEKAGEISISTVTVDTEDGSTEKPDVLAQFLGIVPAVRVSHYLDSDDYPELRLNYLHPGIELAEQYQDIKDDHVVGMKKHGYPLFFSKPITCPTCNGRKQIFNATLISADFPQGNYMPCGNCNGLGNVRFEKGDVTEGITVPISDDPNDPSFSKAAEAPAGFVKNDIESLKAMGEEKIIRKEDVEDAILGTVGIVNKPQQKTATEAVINYQPLEDRMGIYTSNAEMVHNFLANTLLKKRYGDRFVSATIRYGRQYIIRSETEIYNEYKDAKAAGLPDSTLKEYLIEYVKTKFDNNPEAMARALFLLELEPYPTYTTQELVTLNSPVEIIPSDVLKLKARFNDLIEQFERDNGDLMFYNINEENYGKRLNDIYSKLKEILSNWEPVVAVAPATTPAEPILN